MERALFPLGRTLITPRAVAACSAFPVSPLVLYSRHVTGDWRDLGSEDQRTNEEAIRQGDRVFSAYQFGDYRFYVITEADRSATTILLADEY